MLKTNAANTWDQAKAAQSSRSSLFGDPADLNSTHPLPARLRSSSQLLVYLLVNYDFIFSSGPVVTLEAASVRMAARDRFGGAYADLGFTPLQRAIRK